MPPSQEVLSSTEHDRQLRRAVIASAVGTAIEWYDFFLYSTLTGLVFAKLFFPASAPLVGTLQAFGVYAVGFVARPVGAAIFGHYGDRIGRKSTLVATLLLMGVATFLVGLVPTYDRIGVWGAVLLTVLRFVQGVGVGGEWGGSILLAMEWSKSNASRGFVASWPQLGVPCGLLLANLAVFGFSRFSGDAFLSWGWRMPFFLSIALVGVGLWIRLGILETPVFRKLVAENRVERAPMLAVLRRHPREIALCAAIRLAEQGPFYIFTAFVFSYAKLAGLPVSRDFVLIAILVGSLVGFIPVPLAGFVSDRIGRRRMYMIGTVTVAIFGFAYFAMLESGSPTLMFVAIALSLVPTSMMQGPEAALIAESFSGPLRYSGASLGYQLASVIAGGPAPLIATWLFDRTHSAYSVSGYILVCAILTLAATSRLKDHAGRALD